MIKYILIPIVAALWPLLLPMGRNFEYEYATLNAYACLLLIPFAAWIHPAFLSMPRRLLYMLAGIAGNLVPALVVFGWNMCPCASGEFFTFWWLQTLPHLCLGFAVATWVEHARRQGLSRMQLALICGFVLFISCLALATQVWWEPQKRATHIFAGFLHGAIYDSWIPLDAGIVWMRMSHICLALALLTSVILERKHQRWPVVVLCLAAWFVCHWQGRQSPSQAHGLAALMESMPDRRLGPGFTLHYRDRPLDGAFQRRLENIYQSARFHSQDLMRILAVSHPDVHIFVYPSRETKKLWFGGDGTDITDVVTPSIHITIDGWPHSTLRHELVHAIASRFADHGLGFHPNMAFTEGLAVALAPRDDGLSLHDGAADIIQNRRVAQIEQLFSPMFWSESGSRAYTVAGSLILYLLDHGGLSKVKALYAGSSWEEAFGQPAERIIGAWQSWLRKHYMVEGPALQAESLYRYPGILRDACPHSKAMLTKTEGFLLKQRQPDGWIPAQDYWPWRVALDQDPTARLLVLQQRFRAMAQGKDDPDFDRDLKAMNPNPPRILEHVEAFLLATDRRIQLGERADAREDLREYITLVQELHIGDGLLRQLWVRWLLLRDVPEGRGQPWLRLLAGIERQLPEELAAEASWVETYLFLRNTPSTSLPVKLLDRMAGTHLPQELPMTFRLEWWKFLGEAYLLKGDLTAAIGMYNEAAKIAPEGSRDSLKLIVEELEYRKEPQVTTH
ncbi:tetratricopeptide repeat protein [Oligoflexus tunisiensis]|uniref:tetratricopeptide repeat protein n=1 Tax=Oligoflexus tunisiensis TaxID=708132 RepID=UPI00114D2B54|nr:tetratricopeptide repeat protein [Oligoflexus tunisiensis]